METPLTSTPNPGPSGTSSIVVPPRGSSRSSRNLGRFYRTAARGGYSTNLALKAIPDIPMAPSPPAPRLAFVCANTPNARAVRARLERRYGAAPPAQADIIVALGGDGLMLQTLHRTMRRRTP